MQRLDHQDALSGLIHRVMKAIRIHTITNDSRSTGANKLKKEVFRMHAYC